MLTRSMHPAQSNSNVANMRLRLRIPRTPAKCGRMRGPTVITIIAANPTVSA
ncbi:MAG: hypothetical protein WBD32_13325 [Acidobacteriaceae bacterium]